MKLSSKSITAIKMFIDLGEHYESGFTSLVDISKRKDVSKKFLEQIVPLFKKANLLECNRGNQGGYKLKLAPNKISLKDIIYLTESFFEKTITDNEPIDIMIKQVDTLLDNYFKSVTLDKLIEQQQNSYSSNYII